MPRHRSARGRELHSPRPHDHTDAIENGGALGANTIGGLQLKDNSIVNSKISSSASIAESKLDLDYTTQYLYNLITNIVTVDQKAALDANTTLNASNAVASMADIVAAAFGISGAVDTYNDLPDPTGIYDNVIYIVRYDVIGHPNGLYKVVAGVWSFLDGLNLQDASEVPYDNSTSGLLATDVQDAIDELSMSSSTVLQGVRFVAKNGDDLTADGSINKPFATLQAAFNSLTTDESLVIVSPGTYAETPMISNDGNVVIEMSSVVVTGNISWAVSSAATNAQLFINGHNNSNIGGVEVNSSSTAAQSIGLINITVGNISYNGSQPFTVQLNNSLHSGAINASSSNIVLNANDCKSIGSITNNVLIGAINDCVISSPWISTNSTGGGRLLNTIFSAVAHDFSGYGLGDIYMDANTFASYYSNVPTKGTYQVILIDSASGIYYDNSISGLLSTNIQDAIDELATVSGVPYKVYETTLTPTDISSKCVTVDNIITNADRVILYIRNAPNQQVDQDYYVNAGINSVCWDGKDLDGVLESGDFVTILYV